MLACGCSATPGLWHTYAYINGGGMNLEWFRREIANRGLDTEAISFEDLNARAEGVTPTDEDPLFLPHLGGRVCPSQPRLRGAWVGLSREHTLGHLYRAMLEGVALEYGLYQRALRALNPNLPMTELRITGGGEKSALWNRLKAEVLGMPVAGLARAEGAPLGAALLAGVGVGVLADLPTAAGRWIRVAPLTRPSPQHAARAQRRLTRYADLLTVLNAFHTQEGALLP
jgi:xylulokinase